MKFFITTILLILTLEIFSQNQSIPDFPLTTMINYVEFQNPKFNNPIAGCAFLIETEKGILAVTCKHSLWVAKSDVMKNICFENTLKQWRMHRKDDTTKYIITENLLNENKDELIGEENVYADYLVFSIKENKSDVKPLKIRKSNILPGEKLYIIGWSFQDKEGKQRIYEVKYVKSKDNKLLVEMPDLNLAGTSGSPIVDKDGFLVGIVSNYTFDEEDKKWFGSPCNTDYLIKVLKNNNITKF